MISDQDESPGVEQRAQADRLADLRRLVHNAEIKPAACEDGMLDAHAGGSYDQLEGGLVASDTRLHHHASVQDKLR